MRSVVVLPAPLGPRKPVTSPGRASNVTPSTATTSSNRLHRSLTSITAGSIVDLASTVRAGGTQPHPPRERIGGLPHASDAAAEMVMSGLLLAGGATLLKRTRRGRSLSNLARGWLGYSTLNSAGYYAQTGDWMLVGIFGIILVATVVGFTVTEKHRRPRHTSKQLPRTLRGGPRTMPASRLSRREVVRWLRSAAATTRLTESRHEGRKPLFVLEALGTPCPEAAR